MKIELDIQCAKKEKDSGIVKKTQIYNKNN